MIEEDLAREPEESLICFARQYHRHGQNTEQNHRDLAIGAVMKFAGASPYDISDTHISTCDAVPGSVAPHFVGGSTGDSLVPIWEELVETDE